MDTSGNYMANFDPNNWGWRNRSDDPLEVIGKYGPLKIHVKDVLTPAFGRGTPSVLIASENNPIEMIDRFHIQPGQLDMFVSIAGKDNFNLDAQAESFVYLARRRGLQVDTYYEPKGTHSIATAQKMIPVILNWLDERLRENGLAN